MTEQQLAIAEAFAATGKVGVAGEQAGYSTQSSASRALAHPAVQAEVARLQRSRIANELLPLAIDGLKRVLTKPTARDSDVVAATKVVLANASKLGLLDDAEANALSKLANDELIAIRDELRAKAKALEAKVIDVDLVEEPSGGAFD